MARGQDWGYTGAQAEPQRAGGRGTNAHPGCSRSSSTLMEAGAMGLETREEAVINSALGFGRRHLHLLPSLRVSR